MMSSVQQVNFHEAVQKQYSFKLKAYHNVISSLILFQLIGLIISLFGEMSTIMIRHVVITTNYFTGNMIITFTWLWSLIASLYLTNRASKNMMFTFVTNKLTNHLANFLFMLFISLIGSVSAVLLTIAARLIVFLWYGIDKIQLIAPVTLTELVITIFATFLYHILIFSFGYAIGEMIQIHKSFVWLVPLLLFTLLILSVNMFGDDYVFSFYFLETNLWLFIFKVLVSVFLFWVIAMTVGRRLEVRR